MMHFKPRGNRRDNRIRHQFYPAESGRMTKLEVHHRDGGRNHFSGATEKRGIEISITTIDVAESSPGSGISMESHSPFDGNNGRLLLIETPRYSAAKLEKAVAALDPIAPDIVAAWERDRGEAIAIITNAIDSARLAA